MALTNANKVAVRRHLSYPSIGLYQISPGGGTLGSAAAGWRFFEAYGFLEYRMNNLAPSEEAALTGRAYAALAMVGAQPNAGDVVSVTMSGGGIASPQTLSYTVPSNLNGEDVRLNICNGLASLVSLNAVLQAAGIYSATPFGTGPFAQNAIPLPEVSFVGPLPFTISASGTGHTYPQLTATGALLPPFSSLDGVTTINGYLPLLDNLEAAWGSASQNLDTMKADVWTGRANEIGQRASLYLMWQQRLSDFLGIPINPRKLNDVRRVGAMSMR